MVKWMKTLFVNKDVGTAVTGPVLYLVTEMAPFSSIAQSNHHEYTAHYTAHLLLTSETGKQMVSYCSICKHEFIKKDSNNVSCK